MMGTLKDDSASMKVGWIFFMWMTNVAASGASQRLHAVQRAALVSDLCIPVE